MHMINLRDQRTDGLYVIGYFISTRNAVFSSLISLIINEETSQSCYSVMVTW